MVVAMGKIPFLQKQNMYSLNQIDQKISVLGAEIFIR
jgi:hypothetical protein